MVFRGARSVEALAAAGATHGAETDEVEEPIAPSAVRTMERFGVALGAEDSVGKHVYLIGCDVSQV